MSEEVEQKLMIGIKFILIAIIINITFIYTNNKIEQLERRLDKIELKK